MAPLATVDMPPPLRADILSLFPLVLSGDSPSPVPSPVVSSSVVSSPVVSSPESQLSLKRPRPSEPQPPADDDDAALVPIVPSSPVTPADDTRDPACVSVTIPPALECVRAHLTRLAAEIELTLSADTPPASSRVSECVEAAVCGVLASAPSSDGPPAETGVELGKVLGRLLLHDLCAPSVSCEPLSALSALFAMYADACGVRASKPASPSAGRPSPKSKATPHLRDLLSYTLVGVSQCGDKGVPGGTDDSDIGACAWMCVCACVCTCKCVRV